MNRRRKNGYTDEQIGYLREVADMTDRSNKEITDMFNERFKQSKSVNAIISIKSKHGIKSYTKKYTPNQINYLRNIAPGRAHKLITEMFNKKFNQDRTEEGISSIMHENCIKTGNTGWFEKGRLPENILPVGTEVMREDGYIYVKIKEQNIWKQKHHIIWEKLNGPVPNGYAILFADTNRANFDINNLILVSKAQVLQMNRYDLIKEDAELTRTGIIIADIHLKMGQRKKGG